MGKIKIDPVRAVLWIISIVVVVAVCFFVIFFLSGIFMAVFQVREYTVRLMHSYVSLPSAIALSLICFLRNIKNIRSFVVANSGDL